MSEEVHAMSVDQIDTLKTSAKNFGMAEAGITDILSKFGPEVLALITEAARTGMDLTWIIDTVNKLGPNVLQFFMDMWGKKSAAMGMAGAGMLQGSDPVYMPLSTDAYHANVSNIFDQARTQAKNHWVPGVFLDLALVRYMAITNPHVVMPKLPATGSTTVLAFIQTIITALEAAFPTMVPLLSAILAVLEGIFNQTPAI